MHSTYANLHVYYICILDYVRVNSLGSTDDNDPLVNLFKPAVCQYKSYQALCIDETQQCPVVSREKCITAIKMINFYVSQSKMNNCL